MICLLALAALGSGCQESGKPSQPGQGHAKDKSDRVDGRKGENNDPKEPPGITAELTRLQGTWVAISYEASGMSFEAKEDPKRTEAKITITGNTYQRRDQGTFKIDPAKNPKEINFVPETGLFRGKTLLGIYSLDNDIMKVCESVPSKGGRPTEFKTAPGSGTVLFTYKKEKP
jgi:uncharacterized protein (TIGR03067 family)